MSPTCDALNDDGIEEHACCLDPGHGDRDEDHECDCGEMW